MTIEEELIQILSSYKSEFDEKEYFDEFDDTDVLMDTFGLSQDLKRENKQYWGRQLGMCWQKLIVTLFSHYSSENYKPALKIGADEPCDLINITDAIDTKYRIGSGDAGTLKKFKYYGNLLKDQGYKPLILILRIDNLPAAITACKEGQWDVKTGKESFEYIKEQTKFDLFEWLSLKKRDKTFYVDRT